MKLFWIILTSILIGCSTVPEKTILKSSIKKEENWRRSYVIENITLTRSKGIRATVGEVELEVGRVRTLSRKDTALIDRNRTEVLKKRWGVRFIFRFREWFTI